MLFTFVICNLIFDISFSLEAKLGDGRDGANDTKQETKNLQNETHESETLIKKSELDELIRLKNQYKVRNYIDEIETRYAFFFIPDWVRLNELNSTAHRSIEIRRQKWNYILEEANNTVFVQRLNSEMEKSGMNRATFCEEIAEVCFRLMNNSYVFNQTLNSNKTDEGCDSVWDPLQKESISIFMRSISGIKLDAGGNKETVQLSKLLNATFVQNDIHRQRRLQKLKRNHGNRMQRLKDAFKMNYQKLCDYGERVDGPLSFGDY